MKLIHTLFGLALLFTVPTFAMEQPEKFATKEEFDPAELQAKKEEYSYLANLPAEMQQKIIKRAITTAQNLKELMRTIHAIALVNKQLNAIIMGDPIQKVIIEQLAKHLTKELQQTALWTGKETKEEKSIKILEAAVEKDLDFYVAYQAKNNPDLIKKHPTLLTTAAHFNAVKSGEILLKLNPAQVNTPAPNGDTSLHIAARSNLDDSFTKLLIQYGANVNELNTSRNTPLHVAVNRGNAAIVKLLLAHGAQVNIQNTAGDTPLHRAMKNRYIAIAKILLEDGANPSIANTAGETPLSIAQQLGNSEVINLLLQYQEKLTQEKFKQ